jgi:hypothetical protein
MPAQQARQVIEQELGVPLEAVFEWIELDEPLGSASISQVGGAGAAHCGWHVCVRRLLLPSMAGPRRAGSSTNPPFALVPSFAGPLFLLLPYHSYPHTHTPIRTPPRSPLHPRSDTCAYHHVSPFQVHKAKLRCPGKGRRRGGPFLRPVWDALRGGYTPDIAPGRWGKCVCVGWAGVRWHVWVEWEGGLWGLEE